MPLYVTTFLAGILVGACLTFAALWVRSFLNERRIRNTPMTVRREDGSTVARPFPKVAKHGGSYFDGDDLVSPGEDS